MFAYELKRMYPPMPINMIKKSIMIKLEFTKLLFCFVIRDIIQKTRLKMKRLRVILKSCGLAKVV